MNDHGRGGGPEQESPSKVIKATQRSFDILETLKQMNGARLTELSDELELSVSTIHHHLSTLQQENYVFKEENEYQVGLRFLDLGGSARHRYPLVNSGKSQVDKLAEETGESVQLIVEERGYGIVAYQKCGDRVTQRYFRLGSRLALHATAAGKAILSQFPEDRVTEIIDQRGLQGYTEQTTTTREDLFEEIESIGRDQIVFDEGERWTDLYSVATPIIVDDLSTIGAISVTVPEKRVTEERLRETLPQLVENIATVAEINASYESVIFTNDSPGRPVERN